MRRDWIQTFTGKKFFPLDPKMEDICIEDIAHSLSMQCRFVGHSKQFYSVAEHSIAMVNCWFSGPENKDLAKYAILHDASEAYLCDMPSPIKHLPEFQFYREAEKRLSKMIYVRFGLDPAEPDLIKRADYEILCEEAMSEQIMSPLHPDWLHRCDPVIRFATLSPNLAEKFYLEKFKQLFAI